MKTNKIKHNRTLSKKQIAAMPVIIGARNLNDGIKQAQIARSTFYKWIKDDEFKKAFNEQSKALIDIAMCRLRVAADEATNTLVDLLQCDNETVRHRAASTILDSLMKYLEFEHIEKKLNELEEQISATKSKKSN